MKTSLGFAVFAFVLAAGAPGRALADDDSTVEARARFKEGVALYDEGRYEAARIKFKQAYALKQHPDVLMNLGWSNLKSGHPTDAEEAFSRYLKDAPDAPPAKRAEAEKGLAQAKSAAGNSSPALPPPPAPPAPPPGAPNSGNANPNATPTTTGVPAAPGGAGASGSAAMGTDTPAPAEGPTKPENQPIRVDVLLGYTTDNVNLGIGVRAGKVVTSHVYVGGSLVYNFGTSYTVGTIAGSEKVSTSAFYIGPEVGWELVLAPNFTLRPYAGIGFASFSASTSFSTQNAGASSSASDQTLVFWPGVTALYDVPNTNFMVGGDARLVFVPNTIGYSSGPAFGIFATGGMRF